MNVCRFCGKNEYEHSKLVKYGVRHYAHHRCYLEAGRELSALHPWQVGLFPIRLLKDKGLDVHAADIIKKG